MKILVVDDTRIILSVVEAILLQDGHEVFTASDGREGYSVFGGIQPDMVITDIEMPWQDGLSMMQTIRRIRPDVFTLYMTGNPGPYQQRLAREAETYAAGLLCKPFTRSELLCQVNDVVAKALPLRQTLRAWTTQGEAGTPSPCPAAPDLAPLSSASFQAERWNDEEDGDFASHRYADGPLRAGGRG